MSGAFQNLDLLTVGIAVAGTIVLGFTVYITNTKSATNLTFFQFSLITALWGVLNYLSYQFSDASLVLWLVRGVLFFAVLQTFFLYRLFLVFPENEFKFSSIHKYVLIPLVAIAAIITISPFAFAGISGSVIAGQVPNVIPGPGIGVFAIIAIGLVFGTIYQLVRKLHAARGNLHTALLILLGGVALMFILIIFFNLVATTLFANPHFIPYGALFTFPFIAAASYAILRERLFNIKVIGTMALIFLLSVGSFAEIVFSDTLVLILFRSGIFLLVLVFGVSLIRGVLREVELREEIERLAENLEKTNEQLSEFMSLATHEIRNPATAIKGIAANALEGLMGEMVPSIRDAIQKMFVSANDIVNLGNQYLDKSKLELNQVVYAFEVLPLSTLVENLVYEFQPAAEQKDVTVAASIDKNMDSTVTADKGKIKEVVGNLIDNAIKYNVPKGSVTVSLLKGTDTVTIKIADTGGGIPAEVIPKLFKKFSRADAQKANLLGTGLGLYLAKIFIDAHHGRIWVESEGLGKGSTFFVELPIKQEQAPKAPASDTAATPIVQAA
jgi:signal transduction histidine kinase